MICLYIQSPFAACRTFTAGWYRPTAGFLTPSAAYGLLLNIAGIESRLREEDAAHDGSAPASLIRPGLPSVEIAIGVPTIEVCGSARGQPVPAKDQYPRVQSMYQQLHNYPVGTSGKERAESCRGNKYNITPVRREFLSSVRAIIALRGDPDFEDRILRGLRGEFNAGRYGIPYLGDNAFLLDRIDVVVEPVAVHWFEQQTSDSSGIRDHATRMTIQIDRADLSRTRTALFAPGDEASSHAPSEAAWVTINTVAPPPAAVPSKPTKTRKPQENGS